MKYYSEILNQLFETEKEAIEAEEAQRKANEEKTAKKQKLADERKARAKEVDEAYKAAVEAEKKYSELKAKFVKDYGGYHVTYKSNDGDHWSTFFEEMFKMF